jgi:DNA mismatch endonuclease (patch repair protein)
MPDVFSKIKRSQVMAAIHSTGNKDTELALIKVFKAHGIIGWRRNQRVFGKPDFVFLPQKIAVFVDGCFWHGCLKHGRQPGSNQAYWLKKLQRNRQRDATVKKTLSAAGWVVIRFWEHDLQKPIKCALRMTQAFNRAQNHLKSIRK